MSMNHKHYAVILAAGKGTRMRSELPKVLMEVHNKPMILHVIENLIPLSLKKIVIIVGYKKEMVIEVIKNYLQKLPNLKKNSIEFIEQKEQLGTGHAFLMSEPVLKNKEGYVLVTAGDMPLIRTESFKILFNKIHQENTYGSILGARMENPSGLGRFIRDEYSRLIRIVEEKDAIESEKFIKEVNTGCYVFKIPEIFDAIKKLETNNKQNEYYLPDVIKIYANQNKFFSVVMLDNYKEAMGANTQEELEKLNQVYKEMFQSRRS